jgi:hypothetical protein
MRTMRRGTSPRMARLFGRTCSVSGSASMQGVGTRRSWPPKKYGEKAVAELIGEGGGPVQIDRPLVPADVCKAVSILLDETERELGLTRAAGTSDAARLKAILATGESVPPRQGCCGVAVPSVGSARMNVARLSWPTSEAGSRHVTFLSREAICSKWRNGW